MAQQGGRWWTGTHHGQAGVTEGGRQRRDSVRPEPAVGQGLREAIKYGHNLGKKNAFEHAVRALETW